VAPWPPLRTAFALTDDNDGMDVGMSIQWQ